ncbi:ABC transporter permease [Clostridium sp. KNHs214]|uniref:ABC transporter permease n=1 Tax=Clostridium sp. KNHs214 TaxID=1540257 RepID=UPI0005597451|nr:ABC transporter permease [Clostridium sp. KNHs214]
MKSYLDITRRYLKNQKKRTILTSVGIILSVALICAVGTLLVSFKQSEIEAVKRDDANYHVMFGNVNYEQIKKIKTHMDTEKIGITSEAGESKIYESTKEELQEPGIPKYKYIQIQELDKEALNMLPTKLKEGKLPTKSNEIVLEQWALEYLPKGVKIGDKITLDLGRFLEKENASKKKEGEESEKKYKEGIKKDFILTGIIEDKYYSQYNEVARGITFIDNYGKDKKYNIFTQVNEKKDIEKYVSEVKENLNLSSKDKDKLDVKYNNYLLTLEGRSKDKGMDKSLFNIAAFIISIIVICTILVIYNIFQISVIERIKQFGILRSMGATPKQIRRIVFKEAVVLSGISIPIGLVSGIFAMKILFIVIRRILNDMLNVELIIMVSPKVVIISSLIALVTVYISSIKPALTASKISPLEAIRNNLSNKKRKMRRVKSNLLVKKIFKVEGEIAYKNIKINRKRFVVTISSMVISIVLFILFGSMLHFEEKFNSFKEYSYKDYTLSKHGPINKGFSEKDYEKVKSIKGVDKVYRLFTDGNYFTEIPKEKVNEIRIKNLSNEDKKGKNIKMRAEFKGFDSEQLKLCKEKLISGKINEELMNKDRGVLIVQNSVVYDKDAKKTSMINISDLKVGDEIKIGEDKGEKSNVNNKAKVVGILKESPMGKFVPDDSIYVIATEELFKKIQKDNSFEYMDVILDKNADRDSVTKNLKEFTKGDKRISLMDTKEVLEGMRRTTLTMKIFLYGFITVIALISSLNIANTISTNLMLRKREIAALEAIGMAGKQVKKMVYLEGVLYGIISAILGSLIGSGLSYYLGKMIGNIRGFQWTIPWNFISIAAAGSMLIALISSYFPLRRIKNESLIDNIRMEE